MFICVALIFKKNVLAIRLIVRIDLVGVSITINGVNCRTTKIFAFFVLTLPYSKVMLFPLLFYIPVKLSLIFSTILCLYS